jgi:hypothetical protein
LHVSFINIYTNPWKKGVNACIVDVVLGNMSMGLGCDIRGNIWWLKKIKFRTKSYFKWKNTKNDDDICRQKSIVDISTQRHVGMSTTEVIVEYKINRVSLNFDDRR